MSKVSVYLQLDDGELTRTKKDMVKRAQLDCGEKDQEEHQLLVGDYEADLDIEDNDGLHITLSTPVGFVAFGIDDIHDLIQTVKIIRKESEELNNAWWKDVKE